MPLALPIERDGGGLRREWNGSRSGERHGKRGEDAEVGVERDSIEAANAERAEPVLVLQAAERPLDGSASPVQVTEALGVSRDQRVEAVGLDPAGRGLALTGRAAPLR